MRALKLHPLPASRRARLRAHPSGRPMTMKDPMTTTRIALLPLAAVLLALTGCPRPVSVQDGGEPPFDAGSGEVDAGEVDAGLPQVDAGEVDAGPPPELRVRRVLPPRGPAGGNTVVLLEGSGFSRPFATSGSAAKRVTTLKVGGNTVVDYTIIDDETLELRSPPGRSGPASVAITNPLGSFNCNSCFTYYDELVVNAVSPREGPLSGGTEVTLTGNGFTSDVLVLFGAQSAPQVTLVSPTQLKVIAPPGDVADLVDIVVYSKNGVATQRRVFRYVADTRLATVSPATGPLGGGTVVTLTGAGFSGATAVRFGATDGTALAVVNDGQLTVVSPAGAAGAVDLTLVTPRGSTTARGAFTYADPNGPFALFSVFPHVAAAGQVVTLTGQALDTPGLTVTIGGAAATLQGAPTRTTAQVLVPARAAARRADVVATAGSSRTLSAALTYRIELQSLRPSSGPQAGGTPVVLVGLNFPSDAEAFIGPLKATAPQVGTEVELNVVTARGPGGSTTYARVREASDLENESTLPSVFTFVEALALGRVAPERGAIAGNQLVTVLGAGFGDGTIVTIGPNRAKDVKVIDSHTLTCRTPKGDVGTVDVFVERLAERDTLAGGFSYFDPRSISGGLSGGPLVGTVNVTVLDATQGSYGAPVPLATVVLGLDSATPYQGITDARGQITFSDPSLVKAQVVTAFKEGYETATVTSVNAENLTVFIARTGGGGGPPGPPPPAPPPSIISGRVTGFKPPRPLTSGESLEARVFVAQSSLYGGPPFRGPPQRRNEKWQLTADGAEYLVLTGAGLRAVYAVLGVVNKQLGTFTPYLMGIKRGITTSPDFPANNQNIVLDMQLDLTVPVTIDSPLSEVDVLGNQTPQNNELYAWLDLGAEGFIPNPNNWSSGTGAATSVSSTQAMLQFPSFPRLDGSNFIFLNQSASAATYPDSYYFRRQPGDLSLGVTVGPMLPGPTFIKPTSASFDGTLSWSTQPGPTANIHQVQILRPTLAGNVTVWSVVLPGAETQVVLPPAAVQKLRDEEAGNQLFVVVYSSKSPKFAYNQWTYDTLSAVTWSSFTIGVSQGFMP